MQTAVQGRHLAEARASWRKRLGKGAKEKPRYRDCQDLRDKIAFFLLLRASSFVELKLAESSQDNGCFN